MTAAMQNRTQSPTGAPRAARGRVIAALLLTGAAAAVALGASAPQDRSAVDDVRTTLEQWVETRRLIAEERQSWALAERTLADEIALLEDSIATLRESIETARAEVSETDTKRAGLVAEQERLQAASAGLDELVVDLEARTRAVLAVIPPPILEDLAMMIEQLPGEDGETRLSVAERFRNVVYILGQVNKFNREVKVTSEVRDLGDGSEAEVTALYLGIGQSYYVTADGRAAGVGRPTAEGWQWTPRNEAAAAIAEAIRVYRVERPAVFVGLPVELD